MQLIACDDQTLVCKDKQFVSVVARDTLVSHLALGEETVL